MIMGFVLVIVVSGGLLSLGPSLNDHEGGEAAGYVAAQGPAHRNVGHGRRPRHSTSAASRSTPCTRPRPASSRSTSRGRRVTRCSSPTRSSPASSSTRRTTGEGQGRVGGRRVHHLLQRHRPPRGRHASDDRRYVSRRVSRRARRARGCGPLPRGRVVAVRRRRRRWREGLRGAEPARPGDADPRVGQLLLQARHTRRSTKGSSTSSSTTWAACTPWCSTTARCRASSSR